jgi:predicted phosphodiesterase
VLFATAPLHKLETARERKSGMHLAIISDIHGNCFAFDQVLKDIRQQGIEHLVCLGDALQGGAQPAETLARLRELNCPVVMDNADAWLITGQQTSPGEHTSEQQHAVRAWSLAQLSENDVAFVRQFLGGFDATLLTGGHTHTQQLLREHAWVLPFVMFLSMWMSLLISSAPYDESMVEGFVKKVKWIKRSSYGQAGFPLLQTGWLVSMGLPSACSWVCFSACWSQEPGGCGANQRRMRCDCPGHLEDKE